MARSKQQINFWIYQILKTNLGGREIHPHKHTENTLERAKRKKGKKRENQHLKKRKSITEETRTGNPIKAVATI